MYYNEWDARKSAWLRQLIADGHLDEGVVDERDIRDIAPAELMGYGRLHFFAGIGGWQLACQWAGWAGPIWTASCPCQPFSSAGRGAGFADERHLAPYFCWIVEQCRPPVVVGEQVAGRAGLEWLDALFARLEAIGYSCAAADLAAASVGGPHIRQRLYWVAYSDEAGQRAGSGAVCDQRDDVGGSGKIGVQSGLGDAEGQRHGGSGPARDSRAGPADDGGLGAAQWRLGGRDWDDVEWVRCIDPRDGREVWRPVEPGIMPLAHGVPARVVRISGYGDAIVPQLAAAFLRSVAGALR